MKTPDEIPLADRATWQLQAVTKQDEQDELALAAYETEKTASVRQDDWLAENLQENWPVDAPREEQDRRALAAYETEVTASVSPNDGGPEGKLPETLLQKNGLPKVPQTEPPVRSGSRLTPHRAWPRLPARPRQRRLLVGSVIFLCLLVLGSIIGPPFVRGWFFPAQNSATQRALYPDLSPNKVTAVNSTIELFMNNMREKNWSALWSMLALDARELWQNEQEFLRFEQTKFGALTFEGYQLGPATVSSPWLDPNTTQLYSNAVTLRVSLQVSAPPGLLTAPSERDLAHGLFQNTLFALILHDQTWQVLVAGPADPNAPVLVPTSPPVSRLIIPIFMYHHISSQPTHDLFNFNLTVTTNDFDAQLTWMQQQGYHAITMTDLFDRFYYGKALPAKPMMITLDDGYADVYTYALPVLLTHHMRAVFYIITGMIGGRYVTWNQVRALAQAGMQIASHTIHHVNIGEPPAGTTTQDELVKSKAKLEEILHEPIQFFCYPTGEPFHHDTLAEQKMVLQDLFEDGYLGATLDPAAFDSALQNSQLPYELPRIRVSGGETLAEFQGILATTLRADAWRLQALG